MLLGLLRRNPAERMSAAEVRARLRRIAPATRRANALRSRAAVAAAIAVIAFGGIAFVNQRSGADPAAPAAAPSIALPNGYTWWTDPGGAFRVAVPRGWRQMRSAGGLVCTAPGGQPMLVVALWTTHGEFVPTLIEAERLARPLGYRRVRIGTVAEPPGAVWEYTFQDPRDGAMRALRQIVTVGGRSYEVNWRASAADWAAELPTLLTVLPTVGPAPGE